MKRIEEIYESGLLVPLRGGRSVKENYRMGNLVLGVVRVDQLRLHERDPEFILNSINTYVSGLMKAGVPIVEVLEVRQQRENILIVTSFMPKFLDEEMTENSEKFIAGASRVLEILNLIHSTDLGIDPTPKNFAVSGDKIFYADFFHPLTQAYIDWSRKLMDPFNPQDQYLRFIQDYYFPPKVYAHAVSDFLDLGVVPPSEVLALADSFVRKYAPDFNLHEEYSYYVATKKRLKEKII